MGLKKTLARQLRKPQGWTGTFVGWLMRKGNDAMNRFTVDLLDVKPDDVILEIGFGHGKCIETIAGQLNGGRVAGVDFSETMVERAKKRNKTRIEQGIVDIKQGEVSRIPFEDECFHKVFTVNTLYFWPQPISDLQEIHRVLRPGGKFVLSFRAKEDLQNLSVTKYGFTLYEPEEVSAMVKEAGFSDVKLESAPGKEMTVYSIVALK